MSDIFDKMKLYPTHILCKINTDNVLNILIDRFKSNPLNINILLIAENTNKNILKYFEEYLYNCDDSDVWQAMHENPSAIYLIERKYKEDRNSKLLNYAEISYHSRFINIIYEELTKYQKNNLNINMLCYNELDNKGDLDAEYNNKSNDILNDNLNYIFNYIINYENKTKIMIKNICTNLSYIDYIEDNKYDIIKIIGINNFKSIFKNSNAELLILEMLNLTNIKDIEEYIYNNIGSIKFESIKSKSIKFDGSKLMLSDVKNLISNTGFNKYMVLYAINHDLFELLDADNLHELYENKNICIEDIIYMMGENVHYNMFVRTENIKICYKYLEIKINDNMFNLYSKYEHTFMLNLSGKFLLNLSGILENPKFNIKLLSDNIQKIIYELINSNEQLLYFH